MAIATHASHTRLLLELPGLLPETKLFLIALAETGEIAEAERLTGQALQPALRAWLESRELLREDTIDWNGVAAYAIAEQAC